MPRSSGVSEKVWAQAIHAVSVQRMSLRRAAQMYGVHHMSLHRRVRGRCAQNVAIQDNHQQQLQQNGPQQTLQQQELRRLQQQPSSEFELTAAENAEILGVLREQFQHEERVTSDDVRYVVRAIVGHNGNRLLPPDFPNNRWIMNFKRMYGLLKSPNSMRNGEASGSISDNAMVTESLEPVDHEPDINGVGGGKGRATSGSMPINGKTKVSSMNNYDSKRKLKRIRRTPSDLSTADPPSMVDLKEDGNRYETETSESEYDTRSDKTSHSEKKSAGSNSTESSCNGDKAITVCQQSQTVPAETWERAMDAVEERGMSLRAAARAYGVHFAALHRRLKKRNSQNSRLAPSNENYLPFDDEAGVVRVIHARADLGILMSYEELVDLLYRTASKYTSFVTAEQMKMIVTKFQSRTEHSIRHLIKDWPLPRLDSIYHFNGLHVESPRAAPPLDSCKNVNTNSNKNSSGCSSNNNSKPSTMQSTSVASPSALATSPLLTVNSNPPHLPALTSRGLSTFDNREAPRCFNPPPMYSSSDGFLPSIHFRGPTTESNRSMSPPSSLINASISSVGRLNLAANDSSLQQDEGTDSGLIRL